MIRRIAPLLALVCSLGQPRPVAADPTLPPPVALGGECRLLVSCPWSGPLAAHVRLSGLVWLPQAGDPRPVSVVPSAALSASLWRWAEAGVMFSGRAGAATDGSPALLQMPITLWARVSPPNLGGESIAVAGEVRYAIGRPPFDGGGTVFADSQSYALLVGYRKPRFALHVSGVYQEAGERGYRGFEVSGGAWALVWRALGLEIGAEALARVGEMGSGAMFVAGVRFVDEHGVTGAMGYAGGTGAGLPRHGPLFVFGLSFGPEYRRHDPAPGYEPLLPAAEAWMAERLRRLGARPSATASPGFRPLPGQPAFCSVPAALTVQQLRACVVAADRFELAPPTGDVVLADVSTVVPPPRLSAACDMCQPDPMPDYSPGGAGYFGTCAILRWVRCGEKPWGLPKEGVAAVAPPRPPGMVGVRRAAQVAGAAPRVEGLQPLAPGAPRPPEPPTPPAPVPQPAPRGNARSAVVDAALPAAVTPTRGPRFTSKTHAEIVDAAKRTPDGVECAECGLHTPTPQADHMIPRSRGGSGRFTNGEALCPTCNQAKSNKDAVPWKTAPVDRRMPFVPRKR